MIEINTSKSKSYSNMSEGEFVNGKIKKNGFHREIIFTKNADNNEGISCETYYPKFKLDPIMEQK